MNKAATLAAVAVGAFVAYRAYTAYQQTYGPDAGALTDDGWLGTADDILQSTAQTIDSWTGGLMNISAMRGVDRSLLNNANVRAFLAVIRTGEGTTGPSGYQTLYGGGLFQSFADHPRVKVTKWGRTSSAAGAYQILSTTWDETARIMGLTDFSPASQDLAALGRIEARRALTDVVAGRFDVAIAKVNKEWASMPGSPYGQGPITLAKAQQVYTANGGATA